MDASFLDDEIIDRLITCAKTIKNPKARWTSQKKSKQITFAAVSDCGTHTFRVYLRQSLRIDYAFSCGVALETPDGVITLCRYNGSDHPHRNDIENEKFAFQCHIHRITKRYIDSNYKPDKYAKLTDRYEYLAGAVDAMIEDCSIRGLNPKGLLETTDMFPEGE
jgi:hypothetical protein